MNSLRIAIIGGGGTGAALAWDLSLRGFQVTVFERGELTSGTTGRHHGQLHSGARYALKDREIARECMAETLILRRLVPDAIEYNGGLFVALDEADAAFTPDFIDACRDASIPVREISVSDALSLEPALNPALRRAVWVPDGTIDAFRLPLSFFAGAKARGAHIRPWTEVEGIEVMGGCIRSLRVHDLASGGRELFPCDMIVNAGGPWAGDIAAFAGARLELTQAPGTMVAVKERLCDMVISHLHEAGDGDIIVPQRGLSIIGSTQRTADDPDALQPMPGEIKALFACADAMVPSFSSAPFHAAWSAARPLAGALPGSDGRSLSRDFFTYDHEAEDGVSGMVSIIGGKATVLRAMAEKASDLVCIKTGIIAPCSTRDRAPPSWREYFRRGRTG